MQPADDGSQSRLPQPRRPAYRIDLQHTNCSKNYKREQGIKRTRMIRAVAAQPRPRSRQRQCQRRLHNVPRSTASGHAEQHVQCLRPDAHAAGYEWKRCTCAVPAWTPPLLLLACPATAKTKLSRADQPRHTVAPVPRDAMRGAPHEQGAC